MFNGNMLIGTIEFGNNGAFKQLNWGKHENLWNILGYTTNKHGGHMIIIQFTGITIG